MVLLICRYCYCPIYISSEYMCIEDEFICKECTIQHEMYCFRHKNFHSVLFSGKSFCAECVAEKIENIKCRKDIYELIKKTLSKADWAKVENVLNGFDGVEGKSSFLIFLIGIRAEINRVSISEIIYRIINEKEVSLIIPKSK